MKLLVELIDALLTLQRMVATTGRRVERYFNRLLWTLAFISIAGVLLLITCALLLTGLHQFLALHLAAWQATLLVGAVTLILAGVFLFLLRRIKAS